MTLSKTSWNILNDWFVSFKFISDYFSLWTTIWLEFSPQTIAISSIYLATKFLDIDLNALLCKYYQQNGNSWNSRTNNINSPILNFNWWNILSENTSITEIETVIKTLLQSYRNQIK